MSSGNIQLLSVHPIKYIMNISKTVTPSTSRPLTRDLISLHKSDGLDPGGYGQTGCRSRRESSAASVWGGETACSYDSGYSSDTTFRSNVKNGELLFWKSRKVDNPTPDLLDCLIMEDLEERILQIRAGVTKPSEIVCLKNLIDLADLQPSSSGLQHSEGPNDTSKKRAIIGTGSRDEGVIAPPSTDYYHQDIQKLHSLLEQEVPLTFPGQSIPLNIKLGTDLHTSSINGHTSMHPQSFKRQLETSKTPTIFDVRKLKSELGNDVHLRIGEGFFQLQSLVGERMKLEEILRDQFQGIKLPQKKDVFFGSWGTKSKGRELQEFLDNLSKEQGRIYIIIQKFEHAKQRILEKSLYETYCDWKNLCIQLLEIARTSRGRFQGQQLVEGLKALNKGTRRMRTLLWTLQP